MLHHLIAMTTSNSTEGDTHGVTLEDDVNCREMQTTLPAEDSWPTLLELADQLCGAYEEESPFVCLKDLSFWVVWVLTILSLCFYIKAQIIIMLRCWFMTANRQASQIA